MKCINLICTFWEFLGCEGRLGRAQLSAGDWYCVLRGACACFDDEQRHSDDLDWNSESSLTFSVEILVRSGGQGGLSTWILCYWGMNHDRGCVRIHYVKSASSVNWGHSVILWQTVSLFIIGPLIDWQLKALKYSQSVSFWKFPFDRNMQWIDVTRKCYFQVLLITF